MTQTPLKKIAGEFNQRSDLEANNDDRLQQFARDRFKRGGFGSQWNHHSTLFLKRQVLSRILYEDYLYRRILKVPGVICEFGVHWGATMAILCNLRGIHEPYNHSRFIVGFDTFSGFPDIDNKDGSWIEEGDYATSKQYKEELDEILSLHESFSPISQIKKFELIKGDVIQTLPTWLDEHPHAIVAMAIFDMDIYRPTKAALGMNLPGLPRGGSRAFD